MLCLHPLPTHGGMMDSQIFRKAAARLPALAQIAVLRFNTRGTTSVHGTSEGTFDNGVGERFDVAAAIEYVEFAELPHVWLVGWSFGTDLALRYGNEPGVGAVLLSPPLRPRTTRGPGRLGRVGQAGRGDRARVRRLPAPAEARERFAAIPQAEVIAVPDGKHLWVGQADLVLDLIVERLNPAAAPLPTRGTARWTTRRRRSSADLSGCTDRYDARATLTSRRARSGPGGGRRSPGTGAARPPRSGSPAGADDAEQRRRRSARRSP